MILSRTRSVGFFCAGLLSAGFFLPTLSFAQTQIDWSQPPVACVEEIVPNIPSKTCLDLSQVADVFKEFPANLPPAELIYWQINKKELNYCRAMEVLRREAVAPGSQSAGKIETSWMQKIAVDNREQKITAVYKASRENRLPAQVLTGALYQESMFAELGIAEDGGNYSCGVGQINISEWCHWANEQGPRSKADLQWPEAGVDCSLLPSEIIKPFYSIALTRLNGLPEYRLAKEHFQSISQNDVVAGLPNATPEIQNLRFEAGTSFINHCAEPEYGIAAKAHELALLYKEVIPEGLKQKDVYSGKESYRRTCREPSYAEAYPLNVGWLLAVGTYNAGPRAVDALAYYNWWSEEDLHHPETFANVTIPDLVSSFYWGGKYEPSDDRIHFTKLNGTSTAWPWMKSCVLQRHIARVVQHVTLPGAPVLVDTLEGAVHCAKSEFDPVTGVLIRSSVPPERQITSGRK